MVGRHARTRQVEAEQGADQGVRELQRAVAQEDHCQDQKQQHDRDRNGHGTTSSATSTPRLRPSVWRSGGTVRATGMSSERVLCAVLLLLCGRRLLPVRVEERLERRPGRPCSGGRRRRRGARPTPRRAAGPARSGVAQKRTRCPRLWAVETMPRSLSRSAAGIAPTPCQLKLSVQLSLISGMKRGGGRAAEVGEAAVVEGVAHALGLHRGAGRPVAGDHRGDGAAAHLAVGVRGEQAPVAPQMAVEFQVRRRALGLDVDQELEGGAVVTPVHGAVVGADAGGQRVQVEGFEGAGGVEVAPGRGRRGVGRRRGRCRPRRCRSGGRARRTGAGGARSRCARGRGSGAGGRVRARSPGRTRERRRCPRGRRRGW